MCGDASGTLERRPHPLRAPKKIHDCRPHQLRSRHRARDATLRARPRAPRPSIQPDGPRGQPGRLRPMPRESAQGLRRSTRLGWHRPDCNGRSLIMSPGATLRAFASPTARAETIRTTRWAQKTAWEASAHALEAESTGSVRNQAESGVAGGKTRAKTTAREGPSQGLGFLSVDPF